ncbi:MAG: rhodanese-like domain-containing protein [Ghiorsea sp.]
MKKLTWMMVLSSFLLAASLSACEMSEKTADGYENSSIQHAYQHWAQGEKSGIPFVFLDVRTQGEYDAGHVPGALHIPIQSLAMRLNEVPKDKRLYVYCESGVRSTKASKLLAAHGFSQVENVKASMAGWRNAGYPIEK